MDQESIGANMGSLGLQLIKGLTKEIQGEISIESSPGVKIAIWFKKYPLEYASLLQANAETSD
jgi:two-component sensor histidine kinase